MAVNLNLDNAVRYVHWMQIGDLDGLYQATLKKAEELGVQADRRPGPETQASQAPTGNEAGILRFVNSLDKTSSKADKRKLGVLLGTIEARVDQSGYKPTTTPAMRRIQRRRAKGKPKKE